MAHDRKTHHPLKQSDTLKSPYTNTFTAQALIPHSILTKLKPDHEGIKILFDLKNIVTF
jgi:hypothetical protein